MKFYQQTIAYLIILMLTFSHNVVQGQITLQKGADQKPLVENFLNIQNGFSFDEHNQIVGSTQSRGPKEWITIGTNSSPYGSYNYPVDLYANTSLTQSIYTTEEMNHESCSIEQIVYTYKTVSSNYPDTISTEHFKVWLANTDRTSLSEEAGYWIPMEAFTLVYEGIVELYSGQDQEMIFDLQSPFVYNESNVCIMVEHTLSENTFENHFNFEASTLDDNDKRSRLYFSYDTPFDFTLPTNDPSQTGMSLPQLADVKLFINTTAEGSLAGTITNPAAEPVADALVTILGTDLQTYSNDQGEYEFSFVVPDTYTVRYSAFGYVIDELTVDIFDAVTQDVILAYLPEATVEGTVLDNDNNPVADVSIQLNGYDTFVGTTDASGNFAIQSVYYDDNYVVAFSKNGYETEITDLSVNSPTVDMGNINMTDKLQTPSNIRAAKNGTAAEIDWLAPTERTVYRRDGGELVTQIGHNYAGQVAVFGQVFREPAKLYEMSWYLNNVEYPHEFVNVYVFALNDQGNPTSTIIFEQSNVPNIDLQWTSFRFPDTIVSENGFYMALSHTQRLELGIDGGNDPEYPFETGVNWVSEDYGSNVFLLMEDLGLGEIPGNLMIRAEGYNLRTGKKLQSPVQKPSRALNTYTIHRLEEGQEQNPELWVLLEENITATSFTDDDFSGVDPGWYKYAVKAVYSGNLPSEAAFSNRIENQLSTQVTINLTTNTPNNESMGALVKLTSNNGNHVYTQSVVQQNGVVVFPEVFKETYSILITHDGFEDYTEYNLDFSLEPAYSMDIELIEMLVQPFNLEIELFADLSAHLKWNHTSSIFEDFETCNNFEIEPAGVVDWKYNDVDMKSTIGIENFTYPNENEPHSFMIFNPSQTTPPIDLELNPGIAPRSGDKFLVSFGVNTGFNDDYFISPKLNFGQDFTFSFFAKSLVDAPALNKIRVGYSTTGFQPEDFTWLNSSAIEVPMNNWTSYEYDLDAETKYVCIRNVSDGGYILMIDDVSIYTEEASTRELITYEVYLNDMLMGETTDYTFDFDSDDVIPNETNVAGVKAIYSSGESEMSTIEFIGVFVSMPEPVLQAKMNVFPNPSNGVFTIQLDGEYEVSILNNMGAAVYRKTISHKEQLMLRDLSPGIYVIQAKSDQKSAVSRIIVR
jgi:hypothetical protein